MLTGSPIRRELLSGDKAAGLKLCGFNTQKPVLLVIGGSLGAVHINDAIRAILPDLIRQYQVIHICGKGKVDKSFYSTTGYYQFEYVNAELKDLFATADIVVSRAGANVICELLAMKSLIFLSLFLPVQVVVTRFLMPVLLISRATVLFLKKKI